MCLRAPLLIILWCGRKIFKLNRLERIPLVDLGAPIVDVFALYDYGEPVESSPDQYIPVQSCTG